MMKAGDRALHESSMPLEWRWAIGMQDHDQELAQAFDSQAPKFEVAPVQSDPAVLERLVRTADLASGSLVLDSGCGPGLVTRPCWRRVFAWLESILSREMIDRARKRCAAYGESGRFLQMSVYDQRLDSLGPFDAVLSRYVMHHVERPARFLERQLALVRPGGIVVVNDHITDPDPTVAAHHAAIEIARDRTHTRNLTGGELVDLFAAAGLVDVRYVEEPIYS